jgi:4-hydroxy-tetrahydrodipicolinate synthase
MNTNNLPGRKLSGIIPPLITPLKSDYSLDTDALEKLIEFLIAHGVDGIFILGSSGEAMNVTPATCDQLAVETKRIIGGRVPLLCGVIEPSTARVIERLHALEPLGIEKFVVAPTFYLQNTCQDEIVRHYDAVCAATGNDVIVYNIPPMTHSNILPATIRRIAEIDNVIAYKNSCADFEQLQRDVYHLEGTKVSLFNGAEELCAAAMMFGADGCVPGLANFFPTLFIDLYKACQKRDVAKAGELQKEIWRVRKTLFAGKSWLAAMKYLAARFGFGDGTVSLPVEPLTQAQKRVIDEIIEPYTIGVAHVC